MKKWKKGESISPEYINRLEEKAEAYDKLIAEQEKPKKPKEKNK